MEQKLMVVLIMMLIALVIMSVLYEVYKLHYRSMNIVQLLQASAWNLVREMENNPTFTAKKYRNGIKEDFEEIVVNSLRQLQSHVTPPSMTPSPGTALMPALPMAITLPDTVTSIPGALETIDRNTNFTKDFWFVAQGVRNGLQVFMNLMVLNNPKAAYFKMVEHMKRQRDEFAQKGTTRSSNFTELKIILGLPTEWPKGELPEQLERKHLSYGQVLLIQYAVEHYRKVVFNGLTYKPYTFSGEEGPQFSGEDVLLGMREYIR